MPDTITPSTALVTINASALSTILSADKNDILGKLMAELGDFDPDGSTEAGRKECASKARKVSVAKADLIRLADTLKADAAKVVKGVNAEVKIVESRMDELRDRFLAPVEEFKAREKARVEKWQARVSEIESLGCALGNSAEMREALNVLIGLTTDFEEFSAKGAMAKGIAIANLRSNIATAEKREAEAAELARLRAEHAERDRIAHEERIAAKARAEAEEKAAREAKDAAERAEYERQCLIGEQRRQEALAKAAQEAKDRAAAEVLARAERERQAAIDAAEKAERDRAAAAEKAERDRAAAAEKAERDRIAAEADAKRREQEAAERERAKIAAQQKAEADERARREADIENRRAVNRAVVAALMVETTITEEQAKQVIGAIARKAIPNIAIAY